MTRSAEQIRDEWLHGLMPPGALTRDLDSNLAKLLLSLASPVAQLESDIEAASREISPGCAVQLLADYEDILGPDPCGRDALATTVALRQALAEQRWTASADNSIPGLIAYAAALGVTITIEEPEPAVCGEATCGADVFSTVRDRLIWIIKIEGSGTASANAALSGSATVGVTVYGDVVEPVIANEFALLSCPLQRLAPADTTVVWGFGYSSNPAPVGLFTLNINSLSED